MASISNDVGSRHGDTLLQTRQEYIGRECKRLEHPDPHMLPRREDLRLGGQQQYGLANGAQRQHFIVHEGGNGLSEQISPNQAPEVLFATQEYSIPNPPPNFRSPPPDLPLMASNQIQDFIDKESLYSLASQQNGLESTMSESHATLSSNPTLGSHKISRRPPGPGPGPGPGPSLVFPNQFGTPTPQREAQGPLQTDEGIMGKDWEKIKHLRAEIWGLRSRIHSVRAVLREKQLLKSKADDKLFQFMRKFKFQKLDLHSDDDPERQSVLETLFLDCEKARNDYGPLEDDCNLLESELGSKEYSLEKLETKFYKTLIESQPQQVDRVDIEVDELSSSSSSMSEIGRDYHPLVAEYLSKLGDVDILRERLDLHLDEKESLEEEKARRLRVNLPLPPDDQDWLDNYDTMENDLITQLRIEEDKAEELQQLCLSMGLLDENGNPIEFEAREQQTFQKDLKAAGLSSGYVRYPTLIPPPTGVQLQLEDLHPKTKQGDVLANPKTRVNQWLLHQLRMSALDVNLLAETFKTEVGEIMEEESWQENVLEHWYQDKAMDWPSAPRTLSSGVLIDNTSEGTSQSAFKSNLIQQLPDTQSINSGQQQGSIHLGGPGSETQSETPLASNVLESSANRMFFDKFVLFRWFF